MNNVINFENGISHKLSDDEIIVLKAAILKLNKSDLAEDNLKIKALENLTALFLDHLD